MEHKNQSAKISAWFALTDNIPYLPFIGELWGVFHELHKEKWYIESALYHVL